MYATVFRRSENYHVTGKAQYRVVSCHFTNGNYFNRVYLSSNPKEKNLLITKKPYRVGNLINPRKALGIPKKAH